MGLPRTFVGFSSADINCYWLMRAWKENEHIDFDFTDCQLPEAVNSDDEAYVKRCIRVRINMASTYAMLIGKDTRFQRKFVPWEAEVAIEKKCRLIGINLNGSRMSDERCPTVLRNVGAVFVPYSPKLVAHALEHATYHVDQDWIFSSGIYRRLGYTV
ncbi:MAG TPA: TIR domain-containing protein [Candidatus Limnocylindrales bacterium]|nr:TIR domain-containing protein [Candidatus Limnocylindrales bacterium]